VVVAGNHHHAYLSLEANYSTHMPNEKPRPLGGTGASERALNWMAWVGLGLGVTYPTVVFNVR
jgi:hypothetical protein